ncbi:hypothetical protein D9M71_604680 [compost metagenome]
MQAVFGGEPAEVQQVGFDVRHAQFRARQPGQAPGFGYLVRAGAVVARGAYNDQHAGRRGGVLLQPFGLFQGVPRGLPLH